MSPTLWIVIAVLTALFAVKKAGQVSAGKMPALLSANAVIVDVRSEGEYNEGHLEGVVNIPMDRFKQDIGNVAIDKEAPLLLHCATGGRSAFACRMAKGLGYTSAHNLGSYSRARKLIESHRPVDFFDADSNGPFPWASPLQTWLELMRGDKRDRETAEQVRELLLKPENDE